MAVPPPSPLRHGRAVGRSGGCFAFRLPRRFAPHPNAYPYFPIFFLVFEKIFKLAIDNPSTIWYYNARLAKANLTGSRMDGASPPVLC